MISSPEHHHSMIALSIKIFLNITFTFVNMYNNTFIYTYIYYKWVLNIKVI